MIAWSEILSDPRFDGLTYSAKKKVQDEYIEDFLRSQEARRLWPSQKLDFVNSVGETTREFGYSLLPDHPDERTNERAQELWQSSKGDRISQRLQRTLRDPFGWISWLSRKGWLLSENFTEGKGWFARETDAIDYVSSFEDEENALNLGRVLDVPATIAMVLAEFYITKGLGRKIASAKSLLSLQKLGALPKIAATFAGHELLRAPTEEESELRWGDYIKHKGLLVGEAGLTGAAVGVLGKFVPKARQRVPLATGGFMGLTALKGGSMDQIIESGATILGFEALGLAERAYKTKNVKARRAFVQEALEKAKKYNSWIDKRLTEKEVENLFVDTLINQRISASPVEDIIKRIRNISPEALNSERANIARKLIPRVEFQDMNKVLEKVRRIPKERPPLKVRTETENIILQKIAKGKLLSQLERAELKAMEVREERALKGLGPPKAPEISKISEKKITLPGEKITKAFRIIQPPHSPSKRGTHLTETIEGVNVTTAKPSAGGSRQVTTLKFPVKWKRPQIESWLKKNYKGEKISVRPSGEGDRVFNFALDLMSKRSSSEVILANPILSAKGEPIGISEAVHSWTGSVAEATKEFLARSEATMKVNSIIQEHLSPMLSSTSREAGVSKATYLGLLTDNVFGGVNHQTPKGQPNLITINPWSGTAYANKKNLDTIATIKKGISDIYSSMMHESAHELGRNDGDPAFYRDLSNMISKFTSNYPKFEKAFMKEVFNNSEKKMKNFIEVSKDVTKESEQNLRRGYNESVRGVTAEALAERKGEVLAARPERIQEARGERRRSSEERNRDLRVLGEKGTRELQIAEQGVIPSKTTAEAFKGHEDVPTGFWVSLWELGKRFSMPSREELARLSKTGKILSENLTNDQKLMVSYITRSHDISAKWEKAYSKEERLQLRDIVLGKKKAPNERMELFAKQWNSAFKMYRRVAEGMDPRALTKEGKWVKVQWREKYWPDLVTPEARKEILQMKGPAWEINLKKAMAEGKTLEEAAEGLSWQMTAGKDGYFGNIERQKVIDLDRSSYLQDPADIFRHYSTGFWHWFVNRKYFKYPKAARKVRPDENLLEKMLDKIGIEAGPKAVKIAKEISYDALGLSQKDTVLAKVTNPIRQLNTIRLIGLNLHLPLLQITQMAIGPTTKFTAREIFKAMNDVIRKTYGKSIRKSGATGVEPAVRLSFSDSHGFLDRLTKASLVLFKPTDNAGRQVGAILGINRAKDYLRFLKEGIRPKGITKINWKKFRVNTPEELRAMVLNDLKYFGILDPSGAVKRGFFNAKEIRTIQKRVSDDYFFQTDPLSLPRGWAASAFLKTWLQFYTFGWHQARLFSNNAATSWNERGDPWPLIRPLIGSIAAGELAIMVEHFFTGEERLETNIPRRLLNDIFFVGTLGMIENLFTRDPESVLLGVTGQLMVSMKQKAVGILKGKKGVFEALIEFASGEIALVRQADRIMKDRDKVTYETFTRKIRASVMKSKAGGIERILGVEGGRSYSELWDAVGRATEPLGYYEFKEKMDRNVREGKNPVSVTRTLIKSRNPRRIYSRMDRNQREIFKEVYGINREEIQNALRWWKSSSLRLQAYTRRYLRERPTRRAI